MELDEVSTSALWKQPHDEVFSVEGITSPNYDVSSLQLVRKNLKVAIGTSSVKQNKSVYRTSSQTQVRAVLADKNTGQLSFAMAKENEPVTDEVPLKATTGLGYKRDACVR
ncbi:hypothetical protein JCM19239_1415 [Vibrio variabilis]|uniref:Uncharacterized protein n=1 Tax=Vibrio variabilis TaxID=990271 RepID=A0ABQ0JPE0_9VIBR|nr:hypothetical protein JCM19239_1415 [Vibrio variabilis]